MKKMIYAFKAKSFFKVFALALLLLFGVSRSFGTTRTWFSTTTGGSWTTASNWGGTVPVSGDDIVINCSNTTGFTITLPTSTVIPASGNFASITITNASTGIVTLTGSTTSMFVTKIVINGNSTWNSILNSSTYMTSTASSVGAGKTWTLATSSLISMGSGGKLTINGNMVMSGTATGLLNTVNSQVEVTSGGVATWAPTGQTMTIANMTVDIGGTLVVNGISGSNVLKFPSTNIAMNGKLSLQGNITSTTSGTLTYGASSTLEYAGASYTASSSYEWPSSGPANVTIALTTGTNTINLPSSKTISGLLTLTSGALGLNGQGLILSGTLSVSSGTITGSSTSTLSITGTGALGSGIPFTSGSQTLSSLTMNRTSSGTASLATPLSVTTLTMTNGVLTTSSSNLLTVTGTNSTNVVLTAVANGSYISGPLARVFSFSISAGTYIFPVGKTALKEFDLVVNGTTTASSPTIVVEEFESAPTGASNGTAFASASSATRYWKAAFSSGSITTTGTTDVRLYDAAVTINSSSSVGNSSTLGGAYNGLGGSSINSPSTGYITSLNASPNALGYYIIGTKGCMSGSYQVGTTGSFTNITAAVNALNIASVCGNVYFELQPSYNGTSGETYPITIYQPGYTGSYTVTFRPLAGVTSTLTTSGSASGDLITLNGATSIIFDGVPGGNTGSNVIGDSRWTIANTNTGSVIDLINSASSNTFEYLTVNGNVGSTTSGEFVLGTVTASTGNNSNSILYNTIGAYTLSSTNYQGIYSAGNSSFPNSNNVIQHNEIANFTGYGINISGSGIAGAWNVSNNSLYRTASYTSGSYPSNGILFNATSTTGNTIAGNYIGGQSANGGTTGNPWNQSSNGFIALAVSQASTGAATNITNNVIQNFSNTANSAGATFYGIQANAGNINVGNGSGTGNTIGSGTSSLGISIGGSSSYGIYVQSSNTVLVDNNTVAGITNTYTGTLNTSFTGIHNNSANTITISNNAIYNLATTSTAASTTAPVLVGINSTTTGSTTPKIFGNNIDSLANTAPTQASVMYGINYNGPSSGGLIYKNKISALILATNSSTATITGLNINGGGSTIYNNMIDIGTDVSGSATVTGGANVYGINESGSGTNNYYYNSVYVGGPGITANAPTYAFLTASSSTSTRYLQDNIFFNNRTGTGTNYAYAMKVANVTGLTDNYNDLYAPNTSSSVIAATGATTYTTSTYGTLCTSGCVNVDPLYTSDVASGTAASINLHTTSSSPLAGAGVTPTGGSRVANDDIDGLTRNSSPTIGANELSGCTTPAAPTIGTITQPTCATATASVALSGLPASGSWTVTGSPSGSLGGSGTTGTVTGLAANTTYTFKVTSGACTSLSSGNAVVTAQPVTPSAPTVGTITQPTCATATGSVALSGLPSGSWTVTGSPSGSASGSGSTGSVTGLAANTTYTFVVSNGSCTSGSSGNAIVNAQPVTPSVSSTGSINPTTCLGTDGNITLNGLAATTTYSVTFNKNGSPVSAANYTSNGSGVLTIGSLSAGSYDNIVVTLGGCSSSAVPSSGTITLSDPASPAAGITNNTGSTILTCSTTAISVTATGGTSYLWSGGSTPSTAANSLSSATSYTVTVTNAASCTATASITLTSNITPPTVGITNNTGSTELTCATTVISVTATGADSYTWSGGSTPTTDANSLTSAATYTVTGTDASNGCTAINNIIITSNTTAPTAGITNNTGSTVLTCSTTSISVTATGGTSYAWDGGLTPTTDNNTLTSANTYNVTVTGTNGCTSTANITITSNTTAPTAGITNNTGSNALTCSTTSISVTATGGTSYTWSGGSTPTTDNNTLTSANTYTVTVTGANGCTSTNNIVITNNNTTPSVTLGANPTICTTVTSANISYSGAVGSPDKYSITWGGTASGAGFSNVSNATLSGGNIVISVPGAAPANTYAGTLTVNNSSTGCISTGYSISVTSQTCVSTSTWTGTTNNDWSTASNWSPTGVPNSCGTNVFINSGNPVISATDIQVGNINLSSGATITLSGKNLNVCGLWTGGSGGNAAVVGSGTTFINSTDSAQLISGNTKFDILQINNGFGTSLTTGATVSIATGLHLQSGVLNVSAGTLELLSTSASNNSYIDDFTSGFGGSISGSIKADRFVPVVGFNQHYISSPVSGAPLSLVGASGPDGTFVTPSSNCDETKSANNTAYGSLFEYVDGHQPSGGCMLGNWMIKTSGNFAVGKGYSAYLTGNRAVVLTGTPNTGNLSIGGLNNSGFPTVNTLQGQPIESGWNLVGNPYPSTIDLTIDRTTGGSGFGNQVQVWVTQGPFAGSFQPYVIGSVATPHIIIAPFQAFMVLRTGAGTGSYPFYQAERTRATNPAFHRNAIDNALSLEVNYNGILDITYVQFAQDATTGFDARFDANKQDGSAGRPTIYTTDNKGRWYGINTLPALNTTSDVNVGLRPEANGTMTITPQGIESFDPTTYIYLEDKQTGTWHNLRDGAYTFAASKTDIQNRFVLHFTPPAQILTSDASCSATGMINVTQTGAAVWNYTIADNNSATISTGTLNANSPINVSATAGLYVLTLTDNNGYIVSKNIQVGGSETLTASFTTNATTVQVQDNVNFNSTTAGAATYNWNFGDGNTAIGQTTTHSYQTEGTYNVVLTITSAAGCTSAITRSINVTSRTLTGVNSITGASPINIYSNENRVYIDFSKQSKVDAQIDMYNVLGQLLESERFGGSTLFAKQITNIEAAYVIVRVTNDNQVTTKKVFIINK